MIKDKYIILLIILFLFAFSIRIYFFNSVTTEQWQDAYWMMRVSENLFSGKGYTLWGKPHNIFQPGYPVTFGLLSLILNNSHLSGKIVSFLSSLLIIPIIYLLWKELESKEIALLTTFLVIIQPLVWEFSLRIMTESLFLLLMVSSFFFLFKSKENIKYLPLVSIILAYSCLTRWEGYLLTLSCIITFLYWKRKIIFGKGYATLNWEKITPYLKNKYIVLSFLLFIIPVGTWWLRNLFETGSLIPSYYQRKAGEGNPSIGLFWFSVLSNALTLPVFLISILGLIISFKKWENHLPFYLFFILYSALHMYFFRSYERFAIIPMPLLFGWFSLAVFYFLKERQKYLKCLILILIISLTSYYGFLIAPNNIIEHGKRYDVIKDSMNWFNENTSPEDKLLAGDSAVYGFYTNREVFRYDVPNYYLSLSLQKNPQLSQNPYVVHLIFMIQNNITYFVPYDSLMPHFYNPTKIFADNFTTHKISFKDGTLILNPVNKFEENNQSIYLYKVLWNPKI